ncbi:hypothetical protein C8T65DRAFT_745012 [Cerioporus squamosus]|nr:hypothetical protein C8T65DRAFT_745012 [Cerioporus squamosus]
MPIYRGLGMALGDFPTSVPALDVDLGLDNADEGPSAATVPAARPPSANAGAGIRMPLNRERDDAEEILWQYFRTRSKTPSYDELVMLANSTGMRTEDVEIWFACANAPPKATRVIMSDAQRNFLQNYYIKNGSPSPAQRARLAQELDVDAEVVRKWFANHNHKMRKLAQR